MVIVRACKYLIRPNSKQIEKIKLTLEYCTFVYNKYVCEMDKYKDSNILAKDILMKYKEENSFLRDVDPSALMNVLFRFQNDSMKGKELKPLTRCKRSYSTTNLQMRQPIRIMDSNSIYIPCLGCTEAVIHRRIPENAKIVSGDLIRGRNDDYYFCVVYSYDKQIEKHPIDKNKSIGIDYSSPHFYVDSNGNRINMNHYYRNVEERISKQFQKVSRCVKGSNNYYKHMHKINKLYKKSYNQRNDFLHKLSTSLAKQYDVICVEDLNMNEIATRFSLAKNTYDNGYGKFIDMLKYKTKENGKVLVKVDKFFPSTKRCHICGYINNDLTLNNREWICPNCNAHLDRDLNAAINIKEKGLENYHAVGYPVYAYESRKNTISNSCPA